MDITKYVNILVSAGKDKEKATEYVNAVLSHIQSKMPNESEETYDSILMTKINTDLHGSSAAPFTGLCIGLDRIEDSFKIQKDEAVKAYEKNPVKAVKDGLIKVEQDGKLVPLDARKFLDKAETKTNNNFGKPLPTQMRRQAIFLIEDTIYRGFGFFEAEVGKMYDLKGSINNGFLNIAKDSVKEAALQLNPADLWSKVYSVAGNSPFVLDLVDISDTPKNQTIITKGTIRYIKETSNGGYMIVIFDEDTPDGIPGFSACDSVVSNLNKLSETYKLVGLEVIITGRVSDNKQPNAQSPKNINFFGFIPNPESSVVGEAVDDLGDFSI